MGVGQFAVEIALAISSTHEDITWNRSLFMQIYASSKMNYTLHSRQIVQKYPKATASFSDKNRDQFWLADLRPGQNYVEREFFHVVLQFTLEESAEQYEAIISKTPLDVEPLSLGTCNEASGHCGLYLEDMVFLAGGDSFDVRHWTSAPAWLAIKRSHEDICGLLGPQYFCPQTREFRRMGLPWSTDTLRYALNRSDQISTDDPQFLVNIGRDILPREHELYDAFTGLCIFLDYDIERIAFSNSMNTSLQIENHFFGPLDYGLCTANWAFKRVVERHCSDT
jgi:hypothetical protein